MGNVDTDIKKLDVTPVVKLAGFTTNTLKSTEYSETMSIAINWSGKCSYNYN